MVKVSKLILCLTILAIVVTCYAGDWRRRAGGHLGYYTGSGRWPFYFTDSTAVIDSFLVIDDVIIRHVADGTISSDSLMTTSWGREYLGSIADSVLSYTGGNAITIAGTVINFDGGATPSGDLAGTLDNPSVTNDSHHHTNTTISGLSPMDFTSQVISQWTNDSGYLTIDSLSSAGVVDSIEANVNHDNLIGFVANEHIDWTQSSAGTIHSTNYVDNTNDTVSESELDDAFGSTYGYVIYYEDGFSGTVTIKDTATFISDVEAIVTGMGLAGTLRHITDGPAPYTNYLDATRIIFESGFDLSNDADTVSVIIDVSEIEDSLEAYIDLSDLQGSVTDAQVPDDITIIETDPVFLAALGEVKTITGNWINTAHPWADNEVLDAITVTPINSPTETAIENAVEHDDLQGVDHNEHIDWTSDQGATNIDPGNYTDTDDQGFDVSELDGTSLKLSLDDDGEATKSIDLSSLQDGTGTDDQTIDTLYVSGDTLYISLEDDGEADKSVDLSGLSGGTDDQEAFEVKVDTLAFTKNLSGLDVDVQTALETIDEFDLALDDVTLTDVQSATSSDFHNIGGTDITLTQEEVEDYVGGMFTGNTETGIAASYQDGDGTIDLIIDSKLQQLAAATASWKIIYVDDGGDYQFLANGTTGQYLKAVSGDHPVWDTPSGTGWADKILEDDTFVETSDSGAKGEIYFTCDSVRVGTATAKEWDIHIPFEFDQGVIVENYPDSAYTTGEWTDMKRASGSLAAFVPVYIDSTGRWAQCDSDFDEACQGLTLESVADTSYIRVAIGEGLIYNPTWYWADLDGDDLWVKDTGVVTNNKETTAGNFIIYLGYVWDEDSIWFDPSPVTVEVAP